MNTCDGCRRWRRYRPDERPQHVVDKVLLMMEEVGLTDLDPNTLVLPPALTELGECTLFERVDYKQLHPQAYLMIAGLDVDDAVAVTQSDFGCVQWKTRYVRCVFVLRDGRVDRRATSLGFSVDLEKLPPSLRTPISHDVLNDDDVSSLSLTLPSWKSWLLFEACDEIAIYQELW